MLALTDHQMWAIVKVVCFVVVFMHMHDYYVAIH